MLPKTLRLIKAYGLLAAVSVSIVVHDNSARRNARTTTNNVSAFPDPVALVPLPMTRLEESPFLKTHASDSDPLPEFAAANPARTAQSGVFFLKVAVQAQTREGARNFTPGTQVRVLQSQDGRMKVTRDGADFVVEDWQITSDPETAARLARSAS